MLRDLLLIGCLFASVASAGICFTTRHRWWGGVYFGCGVLIAWVLLTGFPGWTI